MDLPEVTSVLVQKENWDDDLVYFHVVEAASSAAILADIALYHVFNWRKLFDLTQWSWTEIYVFLGPLIGLAFEVLLVDSTSLLPEFEFGLPGVSLFDEVLIVTSVAANLGSVLNIAQAVSALIVLAAAMAILLVLTLGIFSIPVIIGFFVVIAAAFLVPFTSHIVGFIMGSVFLSLLATMSYDILELFFTNPAQLEDDVDLLVHGHLTPYLQQLEDFFEDNLQEFFVTLFGTQFVSDIKEDFWLLFTAQAIIFILAVPWALSKALLGTFALFTVIEWDYAKSKYINDISTYGLLVIFIKLLIFDGPLAALGESILDEFVVGLIDMVLPSLDLTNTIRMGLNISGFSIPIFIKEIYENAVLELQGFFWIAYLFWKYSKRNSSLIVGDQTAAYDISIGGIFSSISTFIDLDGNAFAQFQWTLKNLDAQVVFPLIFVVAWLFKIPFLLEMKR